MGSGDERPRLRHRVAGRFPSLVIARRNVSRAKVRSALAALAILIGVVAIGAIGAGGTAFKQGQLEIIEDAGATDVYVAPGFEKDEQYFDREDVRAIEATVDSADVVATKGATREMPQRGGQRESVSITYLEDPRLLYDVESGSIPDRWRRGAVVSHGFATEHDLEVGDRLRLVDEEETATGTVETEQSYRVVAVLAETQAPLADDVFLSIEQADDRRYDQIQITTRSVDRAAVVADRLRDQFNDRKDYLLVIELTSIVRLLESIVDGINMFLAGLGSIALLVAGVSIANTMLMSVIKRREEIGVLRAVGYTRRDIVRILMLEAGLLGAIGAAVGVLIALLVAMGANMLFLGNPLAFTGDSLLYLAGSVAFGIGTSLIAGVYPAWRAANKRPVDALRG